MGDSNVCEFFALCQAIEEKFESNYDFFVSGCLSSSNLFRPTLGTPKQFVKIELK